MTTADTPDAFFAGHPDALAIFRAVEAAIRSLGPVQVRTTKSQIAFREGRSQGQNEGRGTSFAFVWRPAQYVRSDVPAVLSIALGRRVDSPRFKEVVHPSARVWMHHLELHDEQGVDAEVLGWLREARERAG